MAHDINMVTDSPPHKRKRPDEDTGDREQKKVHIENRRDDLEDLHLDVGLKYLLCRTRKAPFYFPTPPPASCLDLGCEAISHLQLYGS